MTAYYTEQVEVAGMLYRCRWVHRNAGYTLICGFCFQGVLYREHPTRYTTLIQRSQCKVCGARRKAVAA